MSDLTSRRSRQMFREYYCHSCPEVWRFWRPGGTGAAEKHAFVLHTLPEFQGEFRTVAKRQWKPLDQDVMQ